MPGNLPMASAQPSRDKFLKGNFKFCIGHQLLGGDIREDYPDGGRSLMARAQTHGLDALLGMKSSLALEILDVHTEYLSDEEDDDDELDGEEESVDEDDDEGEEEALEDSEGGLAA
jgi:hypothetical protein